MTVKNKKINSILLIDIPTYQVQLPEDHRALLKERLNHQSIQIEQRLQKKIIRPSLNYSRGLLIIAANLLAQGYTVHYYNYSDPVDREKMYDRAHEIDLIGITSYTATVKIAATICRSFKNINKSILSVLGGPHANFMQLETLLDFPEFDFVMKGDFLLDFLHNLNTGKHLEDVPGLGYRIGKDIYCNPAIRKQNGRVPITMPAYALLTRPVGEYAHNVRTLMGCPYKCLFCVDQKTIDENPSLSLTAEQVFTELDWLSRRVPAGSLIHFSDSIFNLQEDRTLEIVDRLKMIANEVCYSFDTRVDLVKPEELRRLSKANFYYCRIGIENNDSLILSNISKLIDVKTQINACQMIRKVAPSMAIHGYYITGLPGSTMDSMGKSAQFVQDLITSDAVDVIGNKVFVPYPGTPVFNNPSTFGVEILTRDWGKYDRRSFPVYALNNLSAEDIYQGYILHERKLTEALNLKVKNDIHQDFERLDLGYIYANYVGNG